jgi:type II secretory ATPase GspE/PulE/Tfp pilus assembly ATPase PilB-like protein
VVASGVLGVIAQRLVRIICTECKAPYQPDETALFRYKSVFGDQPVPPSFTGKGCKKCNNTGYKGRTGIFEFLPMDSTLRDLISRNEPEQTLRDHARKNGIKPLIFHGLEKVKAGTTSVEELLRVVQVE